MVNELPICPFCKSLNFNTSTTPIRCNKCGAEFTGEGFRKWCLEVDT